MMIMIFCSVSIWAFSCRPLFDGVRLSDNGRIQSHVYTIGIMKGRSSSSFIISIGVLGDQMENS